MAYTVPQNINIQAGVAGSVPEYVVVTSGETQATTDLYKETENLRIRLTCYSQHQRQHQQYHINDALCTEAPQDQIQLRHRHISGRHYFVKGFGGYQKRGKPQE